MGNPDSLIERTARALAKRVQDGEFPPGSRLPSVRQLAKDQGISAETALRAYDRLVARGYLEPRRGSGFYVKKPTSPNKPGRVRALDISPLPGDWRKIFDSNAPFSHRPGSGLLPPAWLNTRSFSGALHSVSKTSPEILADYLPTHGYLPLRQQLQLKLAEHGIHAQTNDIVTTTGATEALHLLVWSNFREGDFVVIEEPCSPAHVQRLLASGVEPLRVPRLEDGPDVSVLRALCERFRPRGLICSSLLQNPTSTNLTPYKAHQILRLAEEFNFLIIDDDSYGDLLSTTAAANSSRLAALDQLQRVAHIGSFSKTISSGLRCGFIAASPDLVEKVLLYKAVSSMRSCTLAERVVYQVLTDGKYRHHCEQLRSRLDELREPLRRSLVGRGFRVSPSNSGMFLWAVPPQRIEPSALAKQLEDAGFTMAWGHMFEGGIDATCFRFNIPATSLGQTLEAVDLILAVQVHGP